MDLKPGSRWKSAVCTAEVVVVHSPQDRIVLSCGGNAMLASTEAKPEGLLPAPNLSGGVLLGKRYVDFESGLEVLASRAGAGTLSVDQRVLSIKQAKPLPASD